ncbi:hypothetical protein AJ79_00134 [Helicocarpus griseus UAMH5409]|uniref:F-box domain-containing protein n=1 Tax=Helicocarpus griseus UAMH5409 TaxID=1447875 RepID=A0A2B7YD29_9EURO|nr:hypothetical protein AJ79_00134 [Helicocarpus griseus UAMH5409]
MEPSRDPLKFLNTDCTDIILTQLSSLDVIRCLMVGRYWRDLVSSWISMFGIRHHWSHLVRDPTQLSANLALRLYRELTQRETKLQKRKSILPWSDCAGEVYCQLLGYQEDGSIYPPQKLKFDVPDGAYSYIALSSDGYLLMEVYALPGMETVCGIIILFRLEDTKEMWRKSYRRDSGFIPLSVGKSRFYFLEILENWTPFNIGAYEVQTGHQPYLTSSKPLTMGHAMCDQGVVQRNGDELLLIVRCEFGAGPVSYNITLFNGSNGHFVQEIKVDGLRFYSLILDPIGNFAISGVSLQQWNSSRNSLVKVVQRFSAQSDGLFAKAAIDVVDFPSEPYGVVDPCTLSAASFMIDAGALSTLKLSEYRGSHVSREMARKGVVMGRYLHIQKRRKVTLTPLFEDGKYIQADDTQVLTCPRHIKFVDGFRVMAEHRQSQSGIKPCREEVLLYDFGPMSGQSP